jgi:hypothetical protein
MTATAEQLNVSCAECGKGCESFDLARVIRAVYATDRASDEHRHGLICGQENRSEQAVKLLIQSEQVIKSVRRRAKPPGFARERDGWPNQPFRL